MAGNTEPLDVRVTVGEQYADERLRIVWGVLRRYGLVGDMARASSYDHDLVRLLERVAADLDTVLADLRESPIGQGGRCG